MWSSEPTGSILKPETLEDRRLIEPGDVSDLMPVSVTDKVEGKWVELAEKMVAGEANALNLMPKTGIDPFRAFRHLRAIVKGAAPDAEKRTAALAYLLSLWYDDYSLPSTTTGGWSNG